LDSHRKNFLPVNFLLTLSYRLVYKDLIVALVTLPTGPKSSEEVLKGAFALLGCERWGGASEAGWSTTSDMLRCPYRYYLKRVRNVGATLVGSSSAAQDIGSFLHAVLAAHYAGLLPPPYDGGSGQLVAYPGYRYPCPTPEQMFEALRQAGAEVGALRMVQNLYDGYFEQWGYEDGWQPVAVEMCAGDPKIHTSRYDLVTLVTDGIHDGLWINEHKTASPQTDLEIWQLDGEILGEAYSWKLSGLDEVFGEPLRGVCVNVLMKGAVPRYYRLWQPVNWDLVDDFAKHRRFWSVNMQSFAKLNFWPKSHYGCNARFDRCLFWDHCATLSESFLVPIGKDE
jgi:hypothetical protein